MKHSLLFLISIITLTSAEIPDFNESARTWVQTYAAQATNSDLLAIADLLYYSQKRSENSLEAQQATSAALQELCHYSVSVVQTRMNPSKSAQYPFDKKRYSNTQKIVSNSLEHYFTTNKHYDYTVNAIVHGDRIQSALVKKGITQLREDARSLVAQAINEHLYSLQKLLSEAQTCATTVAGLFKQQVLPKMPTRSFLEYVWACVPQFLINSFVTFDGAYTTTHEQFCAALMKEYDFGNALWLTIESARAAWYRAHYTALVSVLKERNILHDPS